MVGIDLQNLLVRLLRFHRVLRDLLQTPEHQPSINVLRFGLDDFRVLLDRLPQHVLVNFALLRVADHARVDAAENTSRVGVRGIDSQGLFRILHSLSQASGLYIQIGELFADERRAGISLQSQSEILDGFVKEIAFIASLLGIHMAESVVIIGGGPVPSPSAPGGSGP